MRTGRTHRPATGDKEKKRNQMPAVMFVVRSKEASWPICMHVGPRSADEASLCIDLKTQSTPPHNPRHPMARRVNPSRFSRFVPSTQQHVGACFSLSPTPIGRASSVPTPRPVSRRRRQRARFPDHVPFGFACTRHGPSHKAQRACASRASKRLSAAVDSIEPPDRSNELLTPRAAPQNFPRRRGGNFLFLLRFRQACCVCP